MSIQEIIGILLMFISPIIGIGIFMFGFDMVETALFFNK